jgi:sulfur carrier protein
LGGLGSRPSGHRIHALPALGPRGPARLRGTSNPMHVTANGKPYEVETDATVSSFIRDRDLDPRFVLVERNGEPVERSRYDEVRLAEGDRLELVRAVAGG